MAIDRNAPCRCCSTVRQHIQDHYDPGANLTGDENSEQCFQAYVMLDGLDYDSDISGADFTDYLAEIRDREPPHAD